MFGGEQTIATYRDFGAAQDAAHADHVIWGQVVSEAGFRVMAFDVQPDKAWNPGENAFYVSVRGTAAAEVTAYWEALREGATVLQPLGPAPWSPLYGMLRDRYRRHLVDGCQRRPSGA